MNTQLAIVLSLAAVAAAQAPERAMRPSEAKQEIGRRGRVCGTVDSTRYLSDSRGQPTYLDIDKPTKPDFAVMIAGTDRAKFGGAPEADYKDKVICISGQIRRRDEGAMIQATDPAQIEVQGER